MKKIILLFIVAVFIVVPLVSSQETSLGVFRINEPIEIIQICNNETALCDTCNLTSVKFPSASSLVTDVAMQKRSADFNYTLTAQQINDTGILAINGFCETASQVQVFSFTATITGTGTILTIPEIYIYIALLIITFLVSLFFGFLSWRLPYKNDIDVDGGITEISKSKYFKLLYIWLAGGFFMWFLQILTNVANNFLSVPTLANFITNVFIFSGRLSFILTTVIMIFFLYNIYRDILWNKQIREHGKAFIDGRLR